MSWRDAPDLAVRTRGGGVLAASDETFGEKENLLKPTDPRFEPGTFGHRGQIVDGWETRRRRDPGHDWALIRLGLPGLIRGIVVDTSWFTGNYPQECSIEAACVDPLGTPPGPRELDTAEWTEIVPRRLLDGHTANEFPVHHEQLVTHLRLRQYPDGGIARLRAHGEPVGDPRWVAGRPFDLAASEHGGRVADCSNRFYSSPDNLLAAGPARVMGDGWETERRRDAGHDWVVVQLAAAGVVRWVEIDTTCFVGNAPGEVSLTGWESVKAAGGVPDAEAASGGAPSLGGALSWGGVSSLGGTPGPVPDEASHVWSGSGEVTLLPRVGVRPDAVHRFLPSADTAVDRLRLDIFPDGGLARLRAFGLPSPAGRVAYFLRWYNSVPTGVAVAALSGWGGADAAWAHALAGLRPCDAVALAGAHRLPGIAPDPSAWSALTGSSS